MALFISLDSKSSIGISLLVHNTLHHTNFLYTMYTVYFLCFHFGKRSRQKKYFTFLLTLRKQQHKSTILEMSCDQSQSSGHHKKQWVERSHSVLERQPLHTVSPWEEVDRTRKFNNF